MVVLNLSHPPTPDNLRELEALLDTPVERVVEHPVQVDPEAPFAPQARKLLGDVGLNPMDPQACGQAAATLTILRRHGVRGLRAALERDLPAGGAAAPWRRFRTVMHAYVRSGPWQGPEELAFALGERRQPHGH
jgi:hypothetical protein